MVCQLAHLLIWKRIRAAGKATSQFRLSARVVVDGAGIVSLAKNLPVATTVAACHTEQRRQDNGNGIADRALRGK